MLVYGVDINILEGSVHTIKNTDASVVASKETVLAINVDKTKYVAMARDENAGRNDNIKMTVVPLRGWESSNI